MSPPEIQEKIKAAMHDAFRQPEDLEQMLQHKLGDNLSDYGGNIGLNDKISKIIDKFDSQSRLDELVIGAIRQNPGNILLQNLVNIINDINSPVDSHQLSRDCDDMLVIIKNLEFNTIEKVLIEVLSDHIKEKLYLYKIQYKFEDLQKMTISAERKSIQLFIIKKLLLVEYEKLDNGTNTVFKFAQRLANEIDSAGTEPIRNQLNHWVDKTAKEHKIKHPTCSECELPEVLRSYLLIIIQPENNKYRINAYLILNEEDKDNIDPVEPHDIELEQKGVLCTFDEIEEKIPKFIKESEKRIVCQTTKHFELTIQLFLPLDYLNEKVEQWKYSYDDDWDNETLIGEKYSVVVRSYERLEGGDRINALRLGMEKLKNVRTKLTKQMTQDNQIIQDAFEHLKELDNVNWKSLRNQLEKDKIGLKLSCPPPPVSDKKYKELFKAIIISGIPIAIWKRSNYTPNKNLNDDFEQVLNVKSLHHSSNFFNLLLEKRKLAYQERQSENYLGSHLGILCEEPNLEEFPDLKAAIMKLSGRKNG